MMILRLGVGETYPKQPGYLNMDIRSLPNIDIVGDAKKIPLDDGSVNGIETRNMVEHFGRHEIDDLFEEWNRVLKPGGYVHIETVDMGLLMDNWRNIPTENWMDGVLGAQTYPDNFHKMAFTADLFETFLDRAGFDVQDIEQFEFRQIPRIIVKAIKR